MRIQRLMRHAVGGSLILGALLAVSMPVHATLIVFTATLTGPSESPPNNSPGTGVAEVDFDLNTNTMRVSVSFHDLVANTTASHIHCCTVDPFTGTAGIATITPTFPGFPLGVTQGAYDQTFDMSLASSYNSAFLTQFGGDPLLAEAALVNGAFAGKEYLNIHTTAFPSGEIRGFLQPVPEPVSLWLFGTGLLGFASLLLWRRGRT